jgi:NAD(P)-dependent dehydrogenase (short-subunit alcohol dehydrogenase family)
MPTAVVTGANSGIGNALARILIKEIAWAKQAEQAREWPHADHNQGYQVTAVDRDSGAPVSELGCETSELDISSQDDIEVFKQKIGDRPIDLLLNVAGIMYPHESDTLDKVTLGNLQKIFAVSTFGPLLLTQALLPNVLKAQHPRIAVVSSRVGSIEDNYTGRMYSYRSSKTAVDMLFKNLATDLKDRNVTVILLHPGMVKSNLD